MRLLNTATLQLEDFMSTEGVKYAILSHRWKHDEVSLQQLVAGDVRGKLGYIKIRGFCRLAAENGYQHAWIDTCCIDKTSSAELQEAINSMYRWYEDAAVCYVYLSDVHSLEDMDKSAWFTRGWTLQDMIAPDNTTFYNRRWKSMGTKRSLAEVLSQISGVPTDLLKGVNSQGCRRRIDRWSVAQKMSWVSMRVTTRTEDTAYCLMGLFDVNMPMLYGEGHKAFRRLQEEIIRTSEDHSIFAWSSDGDGPRDLLASSPACFAGCANIEQNVALRQEQFSLTNVGLSISLQIMRQNMSAYVALLSCEETTGGPSYHIGIFLQRSGMHDRFIRTSSSEKDIRYIKDVIPDKYEWQRILILPRPDHRHLADRSECLHGFDFRLTSNPLFGVTIIGKARFRLSGYASLKKELFDNWHVLRATFANGPHWLKMDFMIPGNSGPIGRIFFGFSFDLSPVCLLVSRAQALVDLDEESRDFAGDMTKHHEWIEKKIELHLVQAPRAYNYPQPLIVDQPIDSYCALRYHHLNGLNARINRLKTRIEIMCLSTPDRLRAWTVQISRLK